MQIYKRGNVYWIRYMVDGKVHRQSCKTSNRQIAQRWMEAIKTSATAPTFEDAVTILRHLYRQPTTDKGIALGAAWTTYLEVAHAVGKDDVGKNTLERRRQGLTRLVSWLEVHAATIKTVERVSGPIAAQYAADLAASLKTKTRKNLIGELSNIWTLLAKVSPGLANPWTGLSPRDTDGAIGKAFAPDDEMRVLEAARRVGKGWWQVCTIMRHTGLRYSDVARLRWDMIDTAMTTLRLQPHKTARHHIEVALPITEPVREALASLPRAGDYLLPIHAEMIERHGRARQEALSFAEVLRAAGLDGQGYTIHSWRHTAATRLAATGADLATRKRILGHTVDETAARYDHDEHLDETRAALERAAQSPIVKP